MYKPQPENLKQVIKQIKVWQRAHRPATVQGTDQLQEVLPHVEGRGDHGYRLCEVDRGVEADALPVYQGLGRIVALLDSNWLAC